MTHRSRRAIDHLNIKVKVTIKNLINHQLKWINKKVAYIDLLKMQKLKRINSTSKDSQSSQTINHHKFNITTQFVVVILDKNLRLHNYKALSPPLTKSCYRNLNFLREKTLKNILKRSSISSKPLLRKLVEKFSLGQSQVLWSTNQATNMIQPLENQKILGQFKRAYLGNQCQSMMTLKILVSLNAEVQIKAYTLLKTSKYKKTKKQTETLRLQGQMTHLKNKALPCPTGNSNLLAFIDSSRIRFQRNSPITIFLEMNRSNKQGKMVTQSRVLYKFTRSRSQLLLRILNEALMQLSETSWMRQSSGNKLMGHLGLDLLAINQSRIPGGKLTTKMRDQPLGESPIRISALASFTLHIKKRWREIASSECLGVKAGMSLFKMLGLSVQEVPMNHLKVAKRLLLKKASTF